jgi:alkanesulfonate monooxygenase SsuD/methylene tetrahydromethanopterin reductase-like flavin-dependent oxidoreductase (luciferase family)
MAKFSLHYSLQTLEGDWAKPYGDLLDEAVLAERLGFDGIYVAEHHLVSDGWTPSARVVCGALASVTRKVRIGTDIIVLPLSHPITVAEDAAVLDVMSGGRFILGLGLGNRAEEFEVLGLPFRRRKYMMDESLPLIRRLLTEEKVTHKGEFYAFSDVTIYPRCLQNPSVPIWIAAEKSDNAVRRAARQGDSWILNGLTPDDTLSHHLQVYKAEMEMIGKRYNPKNLPLRREVFVASNADKAWSIIDRGIKHLYGDNYFKWGALWDDDGNPVTPETSTFEEFFSILKNRFVVGTPDQVASQLERYMNELGVEHFIVRLAFPGVSRQDVIVAMRLLAEDVMPQLN